jgi:hypothetical protein
MPVSYVSSFSYLPFSRSFPLSQHSTKMLKFLTSLFTPNAKASAQSRGLLLGLDGAGKTTLLHKLRGGEVTTSVPTIGFNVETFESRDWGVRSWDVGGEFVLCVLRGVNTITKI